MSQFTFGQPVLYAGKAALFIGGDVHRGSVIALPSEHLFNTQHVHPATLTAITPPSFEEWRAANTASFPPTEHYFKVALSCAYHAGQASMSVSAPIPVEGEHERGKRLIQEAKAEYDLIQILIDSLYECGMEVHRDHPNEEIRAFAMNRAHSRAQESPSNKEEGVPPGFFEEFDTEYEIQDGDKVLGGAWPHPQAACGMVGHTINEGNRGPNGIKWRVFRPISKEDSQSVGDAEQSESDAKRGKERAFWCVETLSGLAEGQANPEYIKARADELKAFIESTPSNIPEPPEGYAITTWDGELTLPYNWKYFHVPEREWKEVGNHIDYSHHRSFWIGGGYFAEPKPKVETPKTEAVQEDYGFCGRFGSIGGFLNTLQRSGVTSGDRVRVTVTKIQEEGSK